MNTHSHWPWQHIAAFALGLLSAAAFAVVAVPALTVRAGAALGVLIGLVVAAGLEAWEAQIFPERQVTYEAGRTYAPRHVDEARSTCYGTTGDGRTIVSAKHSNSAAMYPITRPH